MSWDPLYLSVFTGVRNAMLDYAFFYPLLMSWLWMVGGLWFYARHEIFRDNGLEGPPELKTAPGASILIPCFNEEDNVFDTIGYALRSRYANLEVIAINDGSSDRTGEILNELAKRHERLRVIHLASNQGKAIALCAGALAARNEFLICIDGDALLHPYAVAWMMLHLASGPRVGAVTGNPRILNRSTILGKLQVGEFSSIVGLIKRAQRIYGRLFTVSGVIAGFRRTALHRVGYWNEQMATEDIDISWRLQIDHWDIRFEPRALCYIYMPETLRGLWRQRLRWAQGGIEVILRHGNELFSWRQRRFWVVALEYLASVIWAYIMFFSSLLFTITLMLPAAPVWYVSPLMPSWTGLLLGTTCLIQFMVCLFIDRRYESQKGFLRNYFWIIWYPFAFWILVMLTTVVALPKALAKRRGQRARWVSPDRGFRTQQGSRHEEEESAIARSEDY